MGRRERGHSYVRYIVLLDSNGKVGQRHELDHHGRLKNPLKSLASRQRNDQRGSITMPQPIPEINLSVKPVLAPNISINSMPPSISSAVSTSTAQMNSLCSVGSVSTLNPIALSNGKNSKNVISTENIIPMPPKLRFKMQCCHEFLCTIPMNGTTLNQIGLRKVDEVQIQPNVIDIRSIMNKL